MSTLTNVANGDMLVRWSPFFAPGRGLSTMVDLTYNSLEDFYTDARDFLANPTRTTSPVTLRRFKVRDSNVPNLDKPLQPLQASHPPWF